MGHYYYGRGSRGNRRRYVTGVGVVKYLLRDEFHVAAAAGSVNGAPAEPGPGTRVVVDTDGDAVSITGGQLVFANPNSTWGDPGFWLDQIARIAGRILKVKFARDGVINYARIGYDAVQSGQPSYGIGLNNANVQYSDTGIGPTVAVHDTSTYEISLVMRSAGFYLFIKGGAFASWEMLYFSAGITSALYPAFSQHSGSGLSIDYIRVPDVLWLPNPLAYDTFTRANGALGTSEATGPDSQAARARTWVFDSGIWTIDTNQAKGTPTQGSEDVVNGDFANWTGDDPNDWTVSGESGNDPEVSEAATGELHVDTPTLGGGMCNVYSSGSFVGIFNDGILTVGSWYLVSAIVDTWSAGALYIYDGAIPHGSMNSAKTWTFTYRAGSVNFRLYRLGAAIDMTIDNVSIKALALSTLFTSLETSTADVLAEVEVTISADRAHGGVVLNLDDAATPANFVIAYHDGAYARLDKYVAGTYTNVISAAVTYAAGAVIRVIKDGTSYSLYYNNAKVGSTSTISDAGIVDNTLHGLFSTHDGNRLDDFAVWARGTDGEYAQLEQY